ncbi:hypothetical protein N0V90_000458 [Kalmusia sp. IMI 367209]|nr:hypothetical protein N0V90_000458 [Kalmusia sp. IMI 367209]
MAEDHGQPDLNLEQILATLASLPQTATPPIPSQQQPLANQYPIQSEHVPSSHHLAQPGILYGQQQSSDPRLSALPNRQLPKSRTSTSTIDPATITEWKHGLRCVSKIATQSPNFVPSIQKLMQDQVRNIKDWEAGRQRLINDQTAKRENEKAHLAVLSLPGLAGTITPLRTPECEKEELEQYDQKVYRACQRMVGAQKAQLKSLGVPFFGVRPDLMLPDGCEAGAGTEDGQEAKKVTKKEVLELQRKMLNHLMELYGD